jgi:hypothetical protein
MALTPPDRGHRATILQFAGAGWRSLWIWSAVVSLMSTVAGVISDTAGVLGLPGWVYFLVAYVALLVAAYARYHELRVRLEDANFALQKELQATRGVIGQFSLDLEQYELEVLVADPAVAPGGAGSGLPPLPPVQLVVGLIFRNRSSLPLLFRAERFTQRIGDAALLGETSSATVTIPPGATKAFRYLAGRFTMAAEKAAQDIEVEYSVVYWLPGVPKKYRRLHRALVHYRPKLDVPHTFVNPPGYEDIVLDITELADGDEFLVGEGGG